MFHFPSSSFYSLPSKILAIIVSNAKSEKARRAEIHTRVQYEC